MTSTPETGDPLSSLVAFALVTTVAVGATLVGIRLAECLRDRDEERGRGR